MKKTTVKICGLKSAQDIRTCGELGVNIAGLVTEYPLPVPWNLERSEAAGLLAHIEKPMQSCLVTGGGADQILFLGKELRPDFVQLHFHETLEDTRKIARELKPFDIGVIKTFPLTDHERKRQFGTTDRVVIVKQLCETDIFGILVDSREPSNASKRGKQADFELFHEVKRLSSKKVILGGGITPENVSEVLEETHAEMIDLMTGVEKMAGVKDEVKLAELMGNLR